MPSCTGRMSDSLNAQLYPSNIRVSCSLQQQVGYSFSRDMASRESPRPLLQTIILKIKLLLDALVLAR